MLARSTIVLQRKVTRTRIAQKRSMRKKCANCRGDKRAHPQGGLQGLYSISVGKRNVNSTNRLWLLIC
ncbi:hypothetical protein PR048_003482 [Dryococelus australis]|uniref:Uncharacterized protein n=1 Tax=Dryococelus australis TaxID=614101 RepID=A0ABQ9IN70_9NEOP|nr:hypothetical protein PR048_003482 [Dryococelus australis]